MKVVRWLLVLSSLLPDIPGRSGPSSTTGRQVVWYSCLFFCLFFLIFDFILFWFPYFRYIGISIWFFNWCKYYWWHQIPMRIRHFNVHLKNQDIRHFNVHLKNQDAAGVPMVCPWYILTVAVYYRYEQYLVGLSALRPHILVYSFCLLFPYLCVQY